MSSGGEYTSSAGDPQLYPVLGPPAVVAVFAPSGSSAMGPSRYRSLWRGSWRSPMAVAVLKAPVCGGRRNRGSLVAGTVLKLLVPVVSAIHGRRNRRSRQRSLFLRSLFRDVSAPMVPVSGIGGLRQRSLFRRFLFAVVNGIGGHWRRSMFFGVCCRGSPKLVVAGGGSLHGGHRFWGSVTGVAQHLILSELRIPGSGRPRFWVCRVVSAPAVFTPDIPQS